MLNLINETVVIVAAACGYLTVAYLLLYFNKWASDWYARHINFDVDYDIEVTGNLAVALRRAGLYLGIGIGLFGVIVGPSQGFVMDILLIAGYGLFVSVLFLGARVFNDFVVLGSFSNTDEVKRGNVAVGFVECGAFIATGIIAMASVMGEGGGIMSAIVFFFIGQLLLLLVTRIYEWTTSWSVFREIEKGNPAAGLLIGGLMVALAVAIHGAIAIDFVSWGYNLAILGIEGLIAVALMLILSIVVDRVFLPGTNIETEIVRDKNVAAIAVVISIKIVGGILISAAVV